MRLFISTQCVPHFIPLKHFVLGLFFCTMLLPISAKAVTIVVNSTNGGTGAASCTLADAIIAANTGSPSGNCTAGSSGGDQIVFDISLNGSTITLTADLPVVTNDLIVTGPTGNNQITISGDDTSSLFIVQGVRLSLLNLRLVNGLGTTTNGNGGAVAALAAAQVTIDNCTLSDNSATWHGGAIFAEAYSSVSLSNSTLSGNSSDHAGAAIMVYNHASINITNSSFLDNSASSTGGAVSVWSSSNMDIENSALHNNTAAGEAGAIDIIHSVVELKNNNFAHNSARYTGGAIRVAGASAHLHVVESTFSSNGTYFPYSFYATNGGAIKLRDFASANVLNSTFSGNYTKGHGGAIHVEGGSSIDLNSVLIFDNDAELSGGAISANNSLYSPGIYNNVIHLKRSFLSNNSAQEAGGAIAVEDNAFVSVIDTTLSNNSAHVRGGGVFADGSVVEFTNSTVSGNDSGDEGGAVYVNNATSLELNNSTLAENIGGSVFTFDSSAAVLRNTVLAGGDCDLDASSSVTLNGGVHIDDGTCGANSTGPSQLGPLVVGGNGPIPTHIPIAGSPLLDHGVGGVNSNPPTDQRGHNRIVGIAVDIGAVELSDPPVFELYNLAAFLQTLTIGQSIAVDLDDYITDSDSNRFEVLAANLPTGLMLDNATNVLSGSPRELGVFITEYTVEDDTGNQVKAVIETTVVNGDKNYRRLR